MLKCRAGPMGSAFSVSFAAKKNRRLQGKHFDFRSNLTYLCTY